MWATMAASSWGASIFSISGIDLFERDWSGEINLFEDTALLTMEFTGEDGENFFESSFARTGEATGDETVTYYQDFEGLVGGQITLTGIGISSAEVEVTTQQEIISGSIIVWDQFAGFNSATNIAQATTESVQVPEAGGLVAASLGCFFLIGAYNLCSRRY